MRRILALLGSLVSAGTSLPITVCIHERLPSTFFKNSSDGSSRMSLYGSKRVSWRLLASDAIRKKVLPFRSVSGDLCEAIFWQDDIYSKPHYYDYKDSLMEKDAARIVSGWTSEECERGPLIVNTFDFVWYSASDDRSQTGLITLPLGPSAAFPLKTGIVRKYALDTFDYLFNYVASLSTSETRQHWFADAVHMSKKLKDQERTKHWCGLILVHPDWKLPTSYGHADPGLFDNCTCDRLSSCIAQDYIGSAEPAQWHSIARRSAFTLSPPGHNFECYRHWEAAEVGSIPVVINTSKDYNQSSPCFSSSAAPFAHAPFIFVDQAIDAFDTMIALATNPKQLAQRRIDVLEWYHNEMKVSVRRTEAALTAAAATADARFGSVTRPSLPSADPHKISGSLLLVPDGLSGSLITNWLNNNKISSKLVYPHRAILQKALEPDKIIVSWMLPDDVLASNMSLAPIVHLTQEPLRYIESVAGYIYAIGTKRSFSYNGNSSRDAASSRLPFSTRDEGAYYLSLVAKAYMPEATVIRFDNATINKEARKQFFRQCIYMAAMFWLDSNTKARMASSFSMKAEDLDPVTLLMALGIRRQKALNSAVDFSEQQRRILKSSYHRISWSQLNIVLGRDKARKIRELTHALEYSINEYTVGNLISLTEL